MLFLFAFFCTSPSRFALQLPSLKLLYQKLFTYFSNAGMSADIYQPAMFLPMALRLSFLFVSKAQSAMTVAAALSFQVPSSSMSDA